MPHALNSLSWGINRWKFIMEMLTRLCVLFVCRQMHCRYDDEIFEHILRDFPEFAAAPHTNLVTLDEEGMKSKEGKERWRSFINACVFPPPLPSFSLPFFFHLAACSIYKPRALMYSYEKKITDFNFGSLIRTDATKEYSETNTIFGAPVLPVRAFRTLLLTDDVPACIGVRYVWHHSNTNTGEMS